MTFVLAALAIAAFFWHPLALLVAACLVAIVVPTEDMKWLLLISACVLFTILNVSKELDGDLINYVNLQDYVGQRPFYTLFDKDELVLISGSYRVSEIGFYAPLWLMSQVFDDSKLALAIASTLGIYVPAFLALNLIGKHERWSKGLTLTIAMFTVFAGLNFVAATHLIRQYISGSLILLGFALFIARRPRPAMLLAAYACTVHNSSILLVPLVVVMCWLNQYRETGRMTLFGRSWRILAMIVFMIGMMAAVSFKEIEHLAQDEAATISLGYFVVVGVYFLIANYAIHVQRLKLRSLHYARVAFGAIYFLSLGFFILGIQLFALRYFAYLEWIYGLMLAGITFRLFERSAGLQVLSRFTVAAAAAAILVVRVAVGPWMYGPGDNYMLSWNYLQVTQLVSR
jgi:hypothetical protein